MTDKVLKQPSYTPIIDHFAWKVKMQDVVEFYEDRCPDCKGTIISLKEENHSRKFCPNCTQNSKQGYFHKLNQKLLHDGRIKEVEVPVKLVK